MPRHSSTAKTRDEEASTVAPPPQERQGWEMLTATKVLEE